MWPGDQQQFRPMGGWPAGAFAPGTYNAGPAAGKGFGGKVGSKGGGGFDEEDRSRDWHCPKCRERNFAKRTHCFRCQNPRPDDCQVGLQEKVKSGQTLNGMVKSYNRKGFGFLMPFGLGDFNDIYYTRENLSPKLETRDIPGQHVTFEILRMPDGKMIATNIRPQGEDLASARATAEPAAGKGYSTKAFQADFTPLRGKEEEDRSRDWECVSCGTRNFVKRTECFQCKTSRAKGFSDAPAGSAAAPPPPPRREISPHAGSRAMAFSQRRQSGSRSSRSRSPVRKKKKKKDKKKKSSSSDSSDESKKDKKKKKKRKKDSSSDSSAKSVRSDSSDDVKVQASGGAAAESAENPEIQKAKNQALEEMLALKAIEPVEARMKEWRALLRKWHPDKNPDKTEVATAVFQFLQKGKPLLENK